MEMKNKIFLFIMLTIASCICGNAQEASNANLNASASLKRTLDYARGHQTFKNIVFKNHEKEFVRLVQEGQNPKVLFIGCSDSRVIPELISSAKPGDLFVIRTAGNFVSNYDPNIAWDGVAASIQYAVEILGIKDIVVCGHSHCGAIQGLFSDQSTKLPQLISKWLKFGEPAKNMALLTADPNISKETLYSTTGQISVIYQLENLLTYPFIKNLVDDQKVFLHGWYFTIETGELKYYDPSSLEFFPLTSLLDKKAA
jgi:carbonic anhydrase